MYLFQKLLLKNGIYAEITAGMDLRSEQCLANRSREELDDEYFDDIWNLPEKIYDQS